jgi:hypothetical protein
VLAVVLILFAALGVLGFRKRLGARRLDGNRPARPTAPAGPFGSRREQMAAWSAAVRSALAARLGGHWHTRTTEELAADPSLAEALGAGPATELLGFLALADRAKFDDHVGLQPPLPCPELVPDWLAALVASPSSSAAPAAAARSTISGK